MWLYLETEVEVLLVLFQGLNLKIIVKSYLSWQNKQFFSFGFKLKHLFSFVGRLGFISLSLPTLASLILKKIYFIFVILKCNLKTHFKASRSILALRN